MCNYSRNQILLSFESPFKVHKRENCLGFDFEFYTISLLVMLKY
jgi:hypothetical protein